MKRVRELLDVDLMGILRNEKLLKDLASDDILMVDVVFALLKPQADTDKVTDVMFGEAMAGEAIGDAYAALLEELTNFSRNPNTRKVLGKIFKKVQEVEDTLLAAAEARINSGELDKIVQAEIEKVKGLTIKPTGGNSSGSSPDA